MKIRCGLSALLGHSHLLEGGGQGSLFLTCFVSILSGLHYMLQHILFNSYEEKYNRAVSSKNRNTVCPESDLSLFSISKKFRNNKPLSSSRKLFFAVT